MRRQLFLDGLMLKQVVVVQVLTLTHVVLNIGIIFLITMVMNAPPDMNSLQLILLGLRRTMSLECQIFMSYGCDVSGWFNKK
mgnify:CR=1 FL=1